MKKILIWCIILLYGTILMAQEANMHATVEFRLNSDVIIKNQNYDYYVNTILPYIAENTSDIEKVLIVGSASPEGRKDINIKLSARRADIIYSDIKAILPASKIEKTNNYNQFLNKTGLNETDYTKLRATYVEVVTKKQPQDIQIITDTIYVVTRDTVTVNKETVYYREEIKTPAQCDFPPFVTIYSDVAGFLTKRSNIGFEVYFHKLSFFADGYFSAGELFGKTYNTDIWHLGLRKYFNKNYENLFLEVYGRGGYFDTDLISENGHFGVFYGGGIGVGYKIKLCTHWMIYPHIRFGADKIFYSNYYNKEGNVNISFDGYVDGQNSSGVDGDNSTQGGTNIVHSDKKIGGDFFDKAYSGLWIGPTFVGIIIQRDFHGKIRKKNK